LPNEERDRFHQVIQTLLDNGEQLKTIEDVLNDHFSSYFNNQETNKFFSKTLDEALFPAAKSRKHDIDSNKKALRKNLWNYIHGHMIQHSSISNIKAKNDHHKHNTKKDFEKNLFKSTTQELYLEFYGIPKQEFISKLINKDSPSALIALESDLKKTMEQWCNEYRRSENVFHDGVKSCRKDEKKREQYFKIASKILNYLKTTTKTTLDGLLDDDELPNDFNEKVELAIKYPSRFFEEKNGKSEKKHCLKPYDFNCLKPNDFDRLKPNDFELNNKNN